LGYKRDVIGHVTIRFPKRHWWSIGTKPLFLMVFEIFNGECDAMVDMTLKGLYTKGQGHSFWYQSIRHIRLPIGCQ